jgi:hypothetical protein
MAGSPCAVEAIMRRLFGRSGVIVLPALLAIWLMAAAMAMMGPTATPWIPDEVMAELSGANYGPPGAPVEADASR